MDQQASSHPVAQNPTVAERKGDRELVVTRVFDAPPGTVFEAWSRPELLRQWWMPRSFAGVSLLACDMDVRTGGNTGSSSARVARP